MPHALDYAPRDPNAPPPATILRAVLRRILWLIYYLCWMGTGVVGGLALAVGVCVSDDYVGAASGLGLLVACVIAWRGRRVRGFHIACMAVGVIGAVAGARQAVEAFNGPHPYLWEVVPAAWSVVAAVFLALALAGGLGLFLRKSLIQRPPTTPVNLDLVRTMAIAPHQRAKPHQTR